MCSMTLQLLHKKMDEELQSDGWKGRVASKDSAKELFASFQVCENKVLECHVMEVSSVFDFRNSSPFLTFGIPATTLTCLRSYLILFIFCHLLLISFSQELNTKCPSPVPVKEGLHFDNDVQKVHDQH